VYPLLGSSFGKFAPAQRAHLLLWCCAAPALIGMILTAVCLAPSVGSLVGLGADHCLEHDDHHAHLCVLHAAVGSLTPTGWGFVLALLLWWLGSAAPQILRMARESVCLRRLERATQHGLGGIRIVNSAVPVALSAGVWAPSVYISKALIDRLSPARLRVVTEHEWAHVHRRDGLRKFMASLLGSMHFPGVRRQLMADLALACEQACDAEAAARVGDRIEVAEAIVFVERLFAGGPPASATTWSFVGGNVEPRVEALLGEPPTAHSLAPRWVMVLAAFGTLGLALVGDSLHHETEALVALLVR
jgi:hypothetical protein